MTGSRANGDDAVLAVGTLIAGVVCMVFVVGLLAVGWFARGLYEDRVTNETLARLCEEGVLCGVELAK